MADDSALTQQILQLPDVQVALRMPSGQARAVALAQALQRAGINLPEGKVFDANKQQVQDPEFPWVQAGLALAGPAAASLLGGGAAKAASAATPFAKAAMGNQDTQNPQNQQNPSDKIKYLALAAMIPAIMQMIKGPQTPGQLLGTIPGGQDLLNSGVTAARQQDVMRPAIMNTAMGMLPGGSFPGGVRPDMNAVKGASYAPAAPSKDSNGGGSGLANVLKLLGAGAGGFELARGGSDITSLLKKLFGGGGMPGTTLPDDYFKNTIAAGDVETPSPVDPSQFPDNSGGIY